MKLTSIHASFLLLGLTSSSSVAPLAAQAQSRQSREAQDAFTGARRELAEIRLLVAADRKYAEAKERLAKLAETLATLTGPEAEELALEVERRSAEVARALGESAAGPDELDEAVLAALEKKEFGFIRELGRRATPGLVRAVRARPDELTNVEEEDPLHFLMRFDPLAADALIGDELARGGFLWRKRVVRAMSATHFVEQPQLWSVGDPPRFLGAGSLRTLEAWVDDPDVGMTVLFILCRMSTNGPPPAILLPTLERHLRGTDAARREEVMRWSRDHAGNLGPQLFERLLGDEDAQLRDFASWLLVEEFPENRSVLALSRDPDASVRRAVVERLMKSPLGREEGEERAILGALLADGDANVRERAWERLGSLPAEQLRTTIPGARNLSGKPFEVKRTVYAAPLEDHVYRSLQGSEERALLPAIAIKLAPALCFELLEVLARDPDPDVVSSVLAKLDETPWWEDGLLRVAGGVLDNPARPRAMPNRFLDPLLDLGEGVEALVRWCIERGDAGTLRFASERFPWSALKSIDPRLSAAFLAFAFEHDRETAAGFLLDRPALFVSQRDHWPPELVAELHRLAADETRPHELRLMVLRGIAEHGYPDARTQEAAGALLASAWDDLVRSETTRHHLIRLLMTLSGETVNAAILRMLGDPALEAVAVDMVENLDESARGADEIARQVIARGYGAQAWEEAVRTVIEAMGRVPGLQDAEILARAVRDPRYSRHALLAIGRLRDPRYLPLLSEIAARPDDPDQVRSVAEALFGYLDEEAAEPLLAVAAKVTDPDLRNSCLAHLEKIREYQDARERWATRKVRAQTREQVIAELVGQLAAKSDEVKVQAIRALATWEAVEAMPRLIELTASGPKSVAAAARAALERLNAPQQD